MVICGVGGWPLAGRRVIEAELDPIADGRRCPGLDGYHIGIAECLTGDPCAGWVLPQTGVRMPFARASRCWSYQMDEDGVVGVHRRIGCPAGADRGLFAHRDPGWRYARAQQPSTSSIAYIQCGARSRSCARDCHLPGCRKGCHQARAWREGSQTRTDAKQPGTPDARGPDPWGASTCCIQRRSAASMARSQTRHHRPPSISLSLPGSGTNRAFHGPPRRIVIAQPRMTRNAARERSGAVASHKAM